MERNTFSDIINQTDPLPRSLREASSVFLLVCLIFGGFGNGMIIIFTLTKYKAITVTKIQMLSLSMSDLAYILAW